MIRYNTENDLLVYYPSGTLNLKQIEKYYQVVKEKRPKQCAARFVSLDEPKRLAFGYDDLAYIQDLVDAARKLRGKKKIKIVLYATKPAAQGIASMVSRVMTQDNYEIIVFKNIENAAEYLGVDAALLEKDLPA